MTSNAELIFAVVGGLVLAIPTAAIMVICLLPSPTTKKLYRQFANRR